MPKLKSSQESNFEFALRLTKALKDVESGIIRGEGNGIYYIDSHTVYNLLYAAVTEPIEEERFELTYKGRKVVEDGNVFDLYEEADDDHEFHDFSPSVGTSEGSQELAKVVAGSFGGTIRSVTVPPQSFRAAMGEYTSFPPGFEEAVDRAIDTAAETGTDFFGRAPVSERAYEATQTTTFPPLIPFGIAEAVTKFRTQLFTDDDGDHYGLPNEIPHLWDYNSRKEFSDEEETPTHPSWYTCKCVFQSEHEAILRQHREWSAPTAVQQTIGKAFQPCGGGN